MNIVTEIANKTAARIDKNFIKKIVAAVLSEELAGFAAKEIEVSIAFVGSAKMKSLNKAFRKIDAATDILSFCEEEFLGRLKKGILNESEFLGELVIDIGQVKKDALAANIAAQEELSWVVIHGALHLLGYDHENGESAAAKMRQKEGYYLKTCNPFKSK
ncbi:MAG TPA: rRNA maturation RNase YbeY [Candidatus Paceibacterota bacterium]|nr:rRNA maturation RNase YbeY [Candidatus Pacearchaeota archaeon]HRZ50706.1 rRNA maturation RNase YbeY [Candidatus Paceibacterota bacterium]HSA36397.1 rRNA maturation RNase YbeY [Candidatus Paceibacterota bacterium]